LELFRRHLARLDHTSWTGLVVFAVGSLGGFAAIGARLLLSDPRLFDVPAMGAYASIFITVGLLLYVRGESD